MMFKPLNRTAWCTALVAMALIWCAGTAQAFLSTDGSTPITLGPGKTPDYLTSPNWANSPPMRKFVDTLPLIATPANAASAKNNLGQYIPVAVPDIVTYPGSDYYVIELVQFTEKMHSDLPATTLRGYRQLNNGTATDPGTFLCGGAACTQTDNSVTPEPNAHFLGPLIVAQKDRPVRVKFINSLATGTGGDLFIPVDNTVMGAGPYQIDYDPVTKEASALKSGVFSQNRATLHLHGGRSPWISDGTPHQWITPSGENPDYPQGVSVVNVPDMPDPGPGAQTFYWTNQQSARFMFYHDHAWGITRLNVYVGEAAGYLIQDETELALINGGILPADQIPLVLEDKTWVDAATIQSTDPTWRWGTGAVSGQITEFGKLVDVHTPKTGDLWWPHVYMPAQNPFDITGIAPMGRWAYGPYFWPPTNNAYQPVPNPYYNPNCDVSNPAQNAGNTSGYTVIPAPGGGPGTPYCQPPEIPGTPNPSWGAEAFMDTPTVNGTAYPVLQVQPKAYRLRILNAAHDRFFNLSLFKADPGVDPNTAALADDPTTPNDEVALTTASATACGSYPAINYPVITGVTAEGTNCATNSEVRMLPAIAAPTMPDTWPADAREGGVPDWNLLGPNWVVIGTEGGFLPQPVVVPPNPISWNNDVTTFNAGNINGGSLMLGPAERSDVIVDFSAFAGQTLILYNDAPAPWPALDPHYDYFTGSPDMTEAGGATTTLPGMGPNIRTVMKIRVANTTPDTSFATTGMAALQNAFAPGPGNTGVFASGQDPIIVGQPAYDTAYNTTFPSTYPNWGVSRIFDKQISFKTLNADGTVNPTPVTITMKTKAIQDEQGETFDDYGRMRAALGLELSNPGAGVVNFIVQTYSDPATEIINPDEIQVWKITHNGVDTHPIHFHLYDVQVLNRVGWDGFIRLPDPTEIGWKDTVRISPLEDTIVALKPVTPLVPFGLPESYRPMNPATPMGDQTELSMVDPTTGEAWAEPNVNRMMNFDWEYVWHCHILSHEENDMMRSQRFNFVENLPDTPTSLVVTANGSNQNDLVWGDPTPVNYLTLTNAGNPKNEIGFKIERSVNGGAYQPLTTTLANVTTYTDTSATAGNSYSYRVTTFNAAGSSLPAYVIPSAATLTAVPGVASPGVTVKFTAAASGGAGSYEYRFWYKDLAGNWVVGQNYSTTATWNWNTSGLALGTYQVVVHVRNVGSTATYQAFGSMNFQLTPPASSTTLSASPSSPTTIGTPINFTAAGAGGSGTYEYRFLYKSPSGNWTVGRDYSPAGTWSWTTAGLTAGTHQILVHVRNVGSTASYEAFSSMHYVLSVPVASVTLTPAPVSPTTAGTTIKFTGAATGGSGKYEYRFQYRDLVGNWITAQNYSTVTTWNWVTTGLAVGTYQVVVHARNVGSTADFEASQALNFGLTSPASTSTLSANPTSPVTVGTTVIFTATADGGSGSYEYKFWYKDLAGNWVVGQNYSTTTTWNWNTSGLALGTYQVVVHVRNVGSKAAYEAFSSMNYLLTPPASSTTLSASQPSPATIGTPINFTAEGAGGSGTYEYRFLYRNPSGTWLVGREYSPTATWSWTTVGLTSGNYQIVVHVRNIGSTATYEALNSMNFNLN